MSVLLSILSYPGANDAVSRHWPYFLRQEAEWIYGIGTTDGGCEWPAGINGIRNIGENKYISGRHLPTRMLDTIQELLLLPWEILAIVEYDTVIFNRIRVEALEHAVAAHYAGGPTWGSKAKSGFHHNPHIMHREAAIKFLAEGRKAVEEGICDRERGQPDPPEASPDVFFTLICERINQPIQSGLWREYSRNSLDLAPHLNEAKEAYRLGCDVIHGIKTLKELEYITS